MAKTVIIIDDDPDDIEIIREAINECDPTFVCIAFSNPSEAMRIVLDDLIILPDYIFIDINMPGINGPACLKEFRKWHTLDKVVITMISTSMPDNVAINLKQLGANFTFQKPTKYEDFHQILSKVFNIACV